MAADPAALYPLRFDPIFEYRPWGGRRLGRLLGRPLPDGPVGEAWILSDRDDHASRVADGSLRGWTIARLLETYPESIMGRLAGRFERFPLLLKFLDARQMLSVQVHPSDADTDLVPAGEMGKTEAWVVIEAHGTSRIYAGQRPGTTLDDLRRAFARGQVDECLASFTPTAGEAVLIPAGTVHSLGGDTVVFEVQENSDVTFRLFDWGNIDPRTGRARPLQVDQGLACVNLAKPAIGPVVPVLRSASRPPRELLLQCAEFRVERIHGDSAFRVGAADVPRVLVCLEGRAELDHREATFAIGRGEVMLLPAVLGVCSVRPRGMLSLLEIHLPAAANRPQTDRPARQLSTSRP